MEEITDPNRLLEEIGHNESPGHEGRVNLDLLAVVRPHRSDKGPGVDVSLTNERRFGWSTRNADLTHRQRGSQIRYRTNLDTQLDPKLASELSSSQRLQIVGVNPLERPNQVERPDLRPALGAATDDGRDPGVFPCQESRRNCRGGSGTQSGNGGGVEHP